MKKLKLRNTFILSSIVFLILFFIWSGLRSNLYESYRPPNSIVDVKSLLQWLEEPAYVIKHKVGGKVYYEIVKKKPIWVALFYLPAGSPSYTIDQSGKFIGWSPANSDYHTPPIIDTNSNQREIIEFSNFLLLLQNLKIDTDPTAQADSVNGPR